MRKLTTVILLASSTLFLANGVFAEGYDRDDRGYGRQYQDRDSYRRGHHEHKRLRLFGWNLPFGWDDDDDDDDRRPGRTMSSTTPGPVTDNKLINKGTTPQVSVQ